VLALIGCLLVAYLQLSDKGEWFDSTLSGAAGVVWLAGLAALPWAPQVSAALVWGFAAFAEPMEGVPASDFAPAAILWGAAAVTCLVMVVRGAPPYGALTVVAAWMLLRGGTDAAWPAMRGEAPLAFFWVVFVATSVCAAAADIRGNRARARGV
jgi:hypothetical protein